MDDIINKYNEGKLEFTLTCPIELLRQQIVSMGSYIGYLEQRMHKEGLDEKMEKFLDKLGKEEINN